MVKIISFDADGTLVDRGFMDYFWNVCIPERYAEKNKLDFEEAKEKIARMYHDVGENDIRWYTPEYWFTRLDLDEKLEDVLELAKVKMEVYPEVPEILDSLKDSYELIVVSNAPREILEFELTALDNHFSHAFSSTSDFNQVRKTGDVYVKVLEELDADARDVLHVGDHWDFDYLAPQEAGIMTFFLDRTGKTEGERIVKDLKEFEEEVRRL